MLPYQIISADICEDLVKLQIQRLQCSKRFHPGLLDSLEPSFIVEKMTEHLIMNLQAKVASRLYDVKTIRIPANWWEHFKQQFFTPFLLHRWPVKYDEVTMEANAYYPGIKIPDHQAFVEILIRKNASYKYN